MPQLARDNVLIAFNAIDLGRDGWESHLPGRMPKFVPYKSTDYEFALNKVGKAYGGGMEIWRLLVPGMPFKHFYPRPPKNGSRKARQRESWRSDIVKEHGSSSAPCPGGRYPMSNSYGIAAKRLNSASVSTTANVVRIWKSCGRSAAEGLSTSFHPTWVPHWPNELEFRFE